MHTPQQTLPAAPAGDRFDADHLRQFERDGFLVAPQLASADLVRRMLDATLDGVQRHIEPIEYEADLHYPGAPSSRDSQGGRTIRRLKQAHGRGAVFTDWLTQPALTGRLAALLGPELVCPLAHHNCIMTKHPAFSSDTGWHQDIRYWSFERPELVTVWLALGDERLDNGCLQVIPGSHRIAFDSGRFDEAVFFRPDLPENAELLADAVPVELSAGDVLFFHCRTLHAATRNFSDRTKYSVVFTFRAGDNPPRPDSRSAQSPELLIHAPRA